MPLIAENRSARSAAAALKVTGVTDRSRQLADTETGGEIGTPRRGTDE